MKSIKASDKLLKKLMRDKYSLDCKSIEELIWRYIKIINIHKLGDELK